MNVLQRINDNCYTCAFYKEIKHQSNSIQLNSFLLSTSVKRDI